MQAQRTVGIVLAAGQSRRMGRDKLVLKARGGKSILETVIEIAARSGLSELAVLISENTKSLLPENTCYRTITSENMAQSVKAAINHAVELSASHVMIILGDMPAITHDDIDMLLKQSKKSPDAIIRAVHKTKPGNPVILPLRYAEAFKTKLIGDEGARSIFEYGQFKIIDVECSAGVLVDIDTPEAYDAYLRG